MGQDDFFERFRALHEMDAKAPLNRAERVDYDRAKERFAEVICAGQKLPVKPGQTARSTFRVAMLLKVNLTIDGALQQTSTLDVSGGGFSAPLDKAPTSVGGAVRFELFVAKGEVISGDAKIVELRGNNRAFLTFVDLKPAQAERLERLLFDETLRQLVRASATAKKA